MNLEGRRIEVRGVVQGVGFRPWVYRLARAEGIGGRVRNDAGGVTIEAFGPRDVLDRFVRHLESSPPPAAHIAEVRAHRIPVEPGNHFVIQSSQTAALRRLSIPPDLAMCPACAAEVADSQNRRYRYPFTNCTNCGPRFTIARDVPYDRAVTTMAPFLMCADCRREYESVDSRRFHAEPNACPACGPQLRVWASNGSDRADPDPLRSAVSALKAGLTVAIKGIGGFHLACDATAEPAVRRLRAVKLRDAKPFAVMVRDLAAAERLAELNAAEARLLQSVERPIVLVRRREGGQLADAVAPRSTLLGLLLPYTPLHQLLLAAMDGPLVMTSGNVANEPMVYQNEEALRGLRGVADLFLVHDRDIETRCDDSVARVIAGAPVVMRRARGFVPRPLTVSRPFARPVLACGAHLKNTFCIGAGDTAHLGPHVGDLENLETDEFYRQAIARMQRFLRVRPEVVAHDLHPGYLSTVYARSCAAALTIGVQHHHAHVASAMAEHGLRGPVLGVVYDGTGYGTDGTSWGGEVLLADFTGFERLATFRGMRLAGGDVAIRQVWRLATALLDDAFDGDPPLDLERLFRDVPPHAIAVVRQMIARRLNAPLAHGVGRYFDALGALVLRRSVSRYEGEVAMEWNGVADVSERRRYGFTLERAASPWVVDLRPLVREAVDDAHAGAAPATISARFHNTVVEATATVVRAAARDCGRLPVVLSGGCFQNPWLAEGIAGALCREFAVHLHQQVPPGDGGIALGQALVADAIARSGGAACA